MTGENEARVPERLVQDREVVARGGDTVAEVLRWSCAEFDLAAWLQGQEAGSGQDARFLQAVEYLTYPAERHVLGGVRVVQDQPFELGADHPWRAGFETDRADQPLGLGFRDRRTGVGWSDGLHVARVGAPRTGPGWLIMRRSGVSRVGGQRNHHLLGGSAVGTRHYSANRWPAMVIP